MAVTLSHTLEVRVVDILRPRWAGITYTTATSAARMVHDNGVASFGSCAHELAVSLPYEVYRGKRSHKFQTPGKKSLRVAFATVHAYSRQTHTHESRIWKKKLSLP